MPEVEGQNETNQLTAEIPSVNVDFTSDNVDDASVMIDFEGLGF